MKTSELAKHLSDLYQVAGHLTPELVLEASRDPDSPLHEEFNWNDVTAAHSWRLEQAARLIRRITVEVTIPGPRSDTVVIRKYVAPQDENQPHIYRDATTLDDEVLKQRLLEAFEKDYRAFRRKWQGYRWLWAKVGKEKNTA